MKSVINNILAKVEQKENTFAMISTERQICEPKTNKQAKTICPKRRRQIITIGVQEPMLQNLFAKPITNRSCKLRLNFDAVLMANDHTIFAPNSDVLCR